MAGTMNERVNLTLVQSYKRAERPDEAALEDTFVPITALNNLLRSPEHHILYGRRGTGKTHILRHLTRQERSDGNAAIYIDLRTIGSSGGLYADSSIPVPSRATALLTDIITAIQAGILDLVLSDEQFAKYLDAAGPALDDLLASANQVLVRAGSDEEPAPGAGQDGPAGPRAKAAADADRDQGTYHVVFGRLTAALERLIRAFDGRGLWIMLDEWSSLPIELQPFLADLMRRSAFTVAGIIIKIGAIERRSRFMEHRPHGSYIGIEPGADTAGSLDIDDYLTFEHDRQEVESFFADVLCRHVTSFQRLEGTEPLFSAADEFLRTAFDEPATFKFLVTFSEGIPRDALQIAALSAALAGRSPISTTHVRRANRDYFRRDKEGRLSRSATGALNDIIEQCIAGEPAHRAAPDDPVRGGGGGGTVRHAPAAPAGPERAVAGPAVHREVRPVPGRHRLLPGPAAGGEAARDRRGRTRAGDRVHRPAPGAGSGRAAAVVRADPGRAALALTGQSGEAGRAAGGVSK